MSNVRPIVFFHCFPASAIFLSSASCAEYLSSGEKSASVEFTVSNIPCVGPEKYAKILYISL
jgi:hypothetical protein